MTEVAVERPESHGDATEPALRGTPRCDALTDALSGSHDPQFWRGAGLSWWRCTCGVAAEFHYRTATGAQLAYGWHLLAVERLRGAPCS